VSGSPGRGGTFFARSKYCSGDPTTSEGTPSPAGTASLPPASAFAAVGMAIGRLPGGFSGEGPGGGGGSRERSAARMLPGSRWGEGSRGSPGMGFDARRGVVGWLEEATLVAGCK